MTIYQVSREYGTIAGAGGLKEVVAGLATSFSSLGLDSSVFIPCYGFIDKKLLKSVASFSLSINKETIDISIYFNRVDGVKLYYIGFNCVETKMSVYTYRKEDEKIFKGAVRGHGFLDNGKINLVFQLAFLHYVYNYLPCPDVINLHDGHTGLIPGLIRYSKLYRRFFKESKLFFTIHNAGLIYHQRFKKSLVLKGRILSRSIIKKAVLGDTLDPLLLASLYSKVITVSKYYANEIMSLVHEDISGGFGNFCLRNKVKIVGIINGISLDRFNRIGIKGLPTAKTKKSVYKIIHKLISNSSLKVWGELKEFNKEPVFLFQNRITEQKGLDLLIRGFREYKKSGGIGSFIVMGAGERSLEELLVKTALEFKDCFIYIEGYHEDIALNLFLCSDFFLLTSIWEPCGLTDFEAQLVGTIPVVNRTGGLMKVIDGETGFTFSGIDEFTSKLLYCDNIFKTNPDIIKLIQKQAYDNIMNNYTWDIVAREKYLPLFRR